MKASDDRSTELYSEIVRSSWFRPSSLPPVRFPLVISWRIASVAKCPVWNFWTTLDRVSLIPSSFLLRVIR